MFRKTHQRVISSIAVLLAVLFMFVFVPDANAAAGITVDGSRKFQTISALGADINPNSWDNGNLKPALDMLIDDGMKTFRVGMDMIDWESTNDNADPNTFNWNYYDPIYSGQTSFDTRYAGSNFANTWAVIDYLHQKGIPDSGIELSFMGPGPSWMGGSSLRSGMENEFVEEVLSAAYWGYTHGHTFGLFSPNSEMDITANEGITMSDTQWADVLNRLAGRMNDLGMTGVKLVGPETCCTVSYAATMRTYPTLMADLAHFDFHNYTGNDNGAAGAVAGSGKDFWISEYNAFDQSFNYLDQGAAGLQVWEAYDSVYNHAVLNGYGSNPGNDSLPFGNTPLLAYDKTTKVYSPRSNFYYFGQLFKWVPIGAQRIYANANSSSVRIEAFQDPATTRLTLVGENTGSAQTLSIALNNVDLPSALQYYQTNSGSHLARGADVPVTAGSATVTVPGNTTFTLTGLGVPDSVAPTTPADLTATGNIGSVSLAWSASSDNVGVARYNIYRSTTPGFIPSDTTRVGQATTTSFSDTGLAAGTYYYLVTAQDAAGNVSPPSNEAQATVTGDTIAPAVSVTAPGNGATVSGTVNVTASATDNVGVAGVQFKIDGTNLGSEITTPPYSTGWDTTTVANGSHSITAVARDAAGNTATSTAVPVTVSNAAPAPRLLLGLDSIQGSADNDAAGEAEAFRFTAAASGQAGTLTLYVDSGSRATNVSVGVYSDAGGRPGTLLTSGSLSAPRTAAWNTITLGTNPAINSGTPYWIAVLGTGGQLNYRDAATGSCSQSNAITGLTSLPATWSPGPTWSTCNLSAYASATARDTTAPSVSITSPTDNATISGRTTVTVSATDNVGVSKVELYVDGALKSSLTSSPYTFTLDTTTLTNATRHLSAVAYDAAGNVGTSAAVTVTVFNDTTAPSVPADVSATAAGMTAVSVHWSASSDDVAVAGYRIWRNGTPIATTTATNYTDAGLTPATTYRYTVAAFDAAGNESAQSASAAATTDSDTTPPTVPTGLAQTGATAATATLSWQPSHDNVGVAGYEYYDAGDVALGTTTGTSHTYTGLACGETYTVGVDAYDAAANVSAKATTTLTTAACGDTSPPTVTLTSPSSGATVSGIVSVFASASDNVGVAGVQFRLDGADLGAEQTTAPYSVLWDTTTATAGSHTLTAVARDAAGNVTTSSPVTVTVAAARPLVLDTQVTTHQATKARTVTSPPLTTAGGNELLIAFLSSDGPAKTRGQTFSSVTGGGLTWTLRNRVNARYGTAEIWTAPAPAAVTRITVTGTRSSGSYVGSITVAAFRNASLTTVGATGGASATSGAPSASLTATRSGSIVWGVGDDWDRATARTVGADQTLVDQYLATGVGDTFWVQRLNSPSGAGQVMTISDTAPTNDQWNLATIEIVPAADLARGS